MAEGFSWSMLGFGIFMAIIIRLIGMAINNHLRRRRLFNTQARRHFVKAASLVAQARNKKLSGGEARGFANSAITEANLALELEPKDAATIVVKSLALEVLKKPAAAVKLLNTALSKDFIQTLSQGERADTFAKRAELTLSLIRGNRDSRFQEVLSDLQESISLKPSNAQVHHMLGACCERIGDREDALVAYRQALAVNPSYSDSIQALERLEGSAHVHAD